MPSTKSSRVTPDELQLLSNYPVLPPPEGVTSNFNNPTNYGKPQVVVSSLLLCISAIFFLNRVYMKSFIVRKYKLDDLTISVGMACTVGYYVASVIGTQRGRIGVHEWDINIPQEASRDLLIPAYLISVLTPPTFLFVKVTFFIMYREIFSPMRWMRISALFGAVFTTLFYTSMAVCLFIFATPHKDETWLSHQSTEGEVLDLRFSVPQSAVGLAIDVFILILPIAAVSKLQMATRRKFAISLIFGTGLLACLGSILSIYYRVRLQKTKDYTWALIPVNTVTLLEMFVGIVCACMPAAAHTCHHHLPSYDSLRNVLHSHYGSLREKLRGNNSTPSSLPKDSSHSVKTSRGVYEGYVNLGGREQATPVDGKPLQTFIRNGSPHDLNHDGIHLTYEMQQQTSASPTPDDGGWTTV